MILLDCLGLLYAPIAAAPLCSVVRLQLQGSQVSALVQSKNAAEEAKLAKKQEESETVRQAHREEARLKEEVTRRRLEAKVRLSLCATLSIMYTSQHGKESQVWGNSEEPQGPVA